ncbi:MAG: hypothetical protein J1E02_05010, partial [Coprobacter sp.]|nr:hypothetical protein [Coprobacter sp.]
QSSPFSAPHGTLRYKAEAGSACRRSYIRTYRRHHPTRQHNIFVPHVGTCRDMSGRPNYKIS